MSQSEATRAAFILWGAEPHHLSIVDRARQAALVAEEIRNCATVLHATFQRLDEIAACGSTERTELLATEREAIDRLSALADALMGHASKPSSLRR